MAYEVKTLKTTDLGHEWSLLPYKIALRKSHPKEKATRGFYAVRMPSNHKYSL